MFINNFDPVAISLFSFEIRWYSLSYIFGILFGWTYINNRFLKTIEDKKLFSDYISYLIIGIIIGGRLGYVIIYNFQYYLQNLKEIIFIWEGGMSFHGGLIGVIASSLIFSKVKKINCFIYLDLVSLAAPIGIFFGRLSNFVNSELIGKVTDLPWAVRFIKVDNLTRHPSQIYEAVLEGVVLFFLLNFVLIKKIDKIGVISSYFLIFYSIFRFLSEFTREPDLQIGLIYNLSVGQIISIVTLMFGTILFLLKNEKNNNFR